MSSNDQPLTTPLYKLHQQLGAKLVPFAGYSMPVQYPMGIIKEHLHTREQAGLFDVSHMGQVIISGKGATQALERLLPVDLAALSTNQMCYALLLNDQGGVRDDLIITRLGDDWYFLVINAACKHEDLHYLRAQLDGLDVQELTDQGLIALQGPKAREVLKSLVPNIDKLFFMTAMETQIDGIDCLISCSGYTGEDGFELSMAGEHCASITEKLLADPKVEPVGLGARDSLRLEAGLCLYGHELSSQTTPVEAGLMWSISSSRRQGGTKEGGFCGAQPIFQQLEQGAARKRVGLKIEGKAPVREGVELLNQQGENIGEVVSGGFSPTTEAPIAMAYVHADYSAIGTQLNAVVRGKPRPVTVTKLPFVAQRYYRG